MQSREARERLLTVLKERAIPLGSDDISWAFASPKTQEEAIAWVKEYLGEETLLTKDELELYEEISSVRKRPTTPGDAPRPWVVYDSDLRAAIESLKESTSMIEKHSRVLEAQREALRDIQTQTEANDKALSVSNSHQKQQQEISRLDFAIDDVIQLTSTELQESEKKTSQAMSYLLSYTADRLSSDDKILEAMSKLATRTMPAPGPGVDGKTVEQWIRTLISLREREAKARIDATLRTYLLEYANGLATTDRVGDTNQDLEEAEADLKSLYKEIGSVVEMAVTQEIRRPLLGLLRKSQEQSRNSQHDWLNYVLSTLEHMILQLDSTKLHTTTLRSYHHALHEIHTIYNTTKAERIKLPPPMPISPKMPKRRKSSASSPTSKFKNRDDRANTASVPLTEQVLRRFNVPASLTGGDDAETIRAALAGTVGAANAKLLAQYTSSENAALEVLGKAMDERNADSLALARQLYKHSEYATIRLTDPRLDRLLQKFNKEIGEVAGRLARVDGDGEDWRGLMGKGRGRG